LATAFFGEVVEWCFALERIKTPGGGKASPEKALAMRLLPSSLPVRMADRKP
jgi:hypothetical protein